MKLYLVRHGESTANKDDIIQGNLDSDLSELGYEQVQKIAQRLKDEEFDLLYSSDLQRAWKTADAINQFHNLELHKEEQLRDIDRGDWTGLSKDEIREEYNKLKDNLRICPPNGESFENVVARIKKYMKVKLPEFKDKKILIAAHSGVIRAIIGSFQNLNLEETFTLERSPNTGLTIIDLSSGEPVIELLNCAKHLEE